MRGRWHVCYGSGFNVCMCVFVAVVRVGFTEVNYVIQAGRIRQVCVMAVGELDKKVSVNLTVLELTPGMSTYTKLVYG